MVEKGYCVPDVAKRLGISDKSLYDWMSKVQVPATQSPEQEEIPKLRAKVKRLTEERHILKEAAKCFAGESKKSAGS